MDIAFILALIFRRNYDKEEARTAMIMRRLVWFGHVKRGGETENIRAVVEMNGSGTLRGVETENIRAVVEMNGSGTELKQKTSEQLWK